MSRHYATYVWRRGLPYGVNPFKEEGIPHPVSYKVASDPYHKRVSIEKYEGGKFSCILYDSAIFDFRQLKQGEQLAWQKTMIAEGSESATSHIRNQDDRLILIEEYRFEGERCRECKAYSPIGHLISVQKILYKDMGDPFNGVSLYDSVGRSVMSKHYEWDDASKQFTTLIKEVWIPEEIVT